MLMFSTVLRELLPKTLVFHRQIVNNFRRTVTFFGIDAQAFHGIRQLQFLYHSGRRAALNQGDRYRKINGGPWTGLSFRRSVTCQAAWRVKDLPAQKKFNPHFLIMPPPSAVRLGGNPPSMAGQLCRTKGLQMTERSLKFRLLSRQTVNRCATSGLNMASKNPTMSGSLVRCNVENYEDLCCTFKTRDGSAAIH